LFFHLPSFSSPRSLQLLQQLRASGLAFGVIECCGALKSCSGASEWQQGLEILELMGGAEEWWHDDVE
jgi:hypothetical protein